MSTNRQRTHFDQKSSPFKDELKMEVVSLPVLYHETLFYKNSFCQDFLYVNSLELFQIKSVAITFFVHVFQNEMLIPSYDICHSIVDKTLRNIGEYKRSSRGQVVDKPLY